MVSNEEIKRRLELRRKGIDPDKESYLKKDDVHRTPVRSEPPAKETLACPECGTMNLESSKFCIGCGNPLKKEEKVEVKSKSIVCPECGTENAQSSKFCIGCGKNLNEVEEEPIEETEESLEVEHEPVSEEEVMEEITEPNSDEKNDFFEEIKRAKELLDMGAITEDEFEKIKNKYLKQFK